MAKELADLVAYCETCKVSRPVTSTVGEYHVLDCGHNVFRPNV